MIERSNPGTGYKVDPFSQLFDGKIVTPTVG